MSEREQLATAFYRALSPHGFERRDGEPCSFMAKDPESRVDLYVDIELVRDPVAFRVVLQDVRATSRRFELLEEFEGLRYYRYDPGEPASLGAALSAALEHLARYGLPWLRGQRPMCHQCCARGDRGVPERRSRRLRDCGTASLA